jgi:hypothetical protein
VTNVVSLPGVADAMVPGVANEKIVALLRGCLERAERGEVSAIAIAAVEPGSAYWTVWEASCGPLRLVGSIALLQAEVIQGVICNQQTFEGLSS